MFLHLADTIVAIASPAGAGSRGIVRLSGPRALDVAAALFVPRAGAESNTPSHRPSRAFGELRLDDDRSAPAECYRFPAPHSYTRQHCVELHTVGSPPWLSMVLHAAVDLGARLAQPGEFTARAFLSGTMALTRAEAVAALIAARSDGELRAARRLHEGSLFRRISAIADGLTDLLALVEAGIDFAEEPVTFIEAADLRRRLTDAVVLVGNLYAESRSVERLADLPSVLLAGPPNVGKSSLFNRLTNMDRAICAATAGTTRDVLTAPLRLTHGEVLLMDSAGLDDSDSDPVSALARQAAWLAANSADLLCVVVDVSVPPPQPIPLAREFPTAGRLLVANKTDLLTPEALAHRLRDLETAAGSPVHPVSALTGAGLDDLKRGIQAALEAGAVESGQAELVTERQRELLSATLVALRAALQPMIDGEDPLAHAELIAADLREAVSALARMTGVVSADDLLARVFARFCIGK